MSDRIVLASGSHTRQRLLSNAGVAFEVHVPNVDERALRGGLEAEGAPPRDIADALAEMKARRISTNHPEALVIGCDQVLAHEGRILGKPDTPEDARQQLRDLSGTSHQLLSAAVVYEDVRPVWRHVGVVRLRMRPLSNDYIDDYLERNWSSVRDSVGAYKLEEEGARLFERIDGDYFTVLGLPLLELLSYLILRGSLRA